MNNNKSPISFYVYRRDGSRNPDIRFSFLEEHHLAAEDAVRGYLLQTDGSRYSLVLEEDVRQALLASAEPVHCIISFQQRRSGAYAVARLYKEKRT